MADNKKVVTGVNIQLSDVTFKNVSPQQPARGGNWAWLEPVGGPIGAVHEDLNTGGVVMTGISRKYRLHVRVMVTDPFLRDQYPGFETEALNKCGIEVGAVDQNTDRPVKYTCDRCVPVDNLKCDFPAEVGTPPEQELIWEGLFDKSEQATEVPPLAPEAPAQ